MPRLRSTISASSMSPFDSVRALLHSIIPAPVRSRSCLTRLAVISGIVRYKTDSLRSRLCSIRVLQSRDRGERLRSDLVGFGGVGVAGFRRGTLAAGRRGILGADHQAFLHDL